MDVPPSAAWFLLGAVLGALLVVAVGAGVLAARRRGPAPRDAVPAVRPRVDDLADFLHHPPGTRPGPSAAEGWVALAGPAPAPATPPRDDPGNRGHLRLATLAVAALTLVGSAAALAAATGAEELRAAPRPGVPADDRPDPGGTEGRLTGAGLVLEQRAVGVTATYPEVHLSSDGDTSRVELRLPTWNCLAAEAPDDPVAAGCARSLVEHAELASPDLVVERDGDRLRVRGRAATWVRPAGSAPQPTGRSYDVELTVRPGRPGEGDASTAVGTVRIGTGTAPLVEGLSELRPG